MDKLLVLLVGPQGAGKTTWCQQHLPGFCRISQDDQGPREHFRLFEDAIQRGEPLLVIDRTNAPKYQRKRYLDLAKQHGYRTRIVWFNFSRAECVRRCQERTGHPTLEPAKAEQAIGTYFRNLQYPTRAEADELLIVGDAPDYVPVRDVTDEIGSRRHLIVGDVHGCFDELQQLLTQLDYQPGRDVLVSVGDLVDRGPRIRETVEFCFGLPDFHMVLGNHEDKLMRYLKGNNVKVGNGLEDTIAAYEESFPPELAARLESLPLIFKTPSGYVVHAGFNPESLPEEQRRDDCIYMRFHGGKTYFDEINGIVWHALWPRTGPRVFFGHIPTEYGPEEAHVVGLDGGCVFGGELRIFDSRDGLVHKLKAARPYAVNEYAKDAGIVFGADQVIKREEYVCKGLIRSDRTDDGQLAIYTYTDACTYANAWDEITRNSRGHIYNVLTGECVAWAFPKFFNLGENREALADQFPWDEPYEIMEKLDGWLGVLYRHEGQFKVATRGSFHSSGSLWATEEIEKYDLAFLPDEATLCFEILTPEQRIILDYGTDRQLVILAAFNRWTGDEYPREEVEYWGRRSGLPVVKLYPPMPLEELKRKQKELEKVEGFVLRFPDGRRVKVKTEWYLELARIMSNLTPITVWQAMQGGRVPLAFLEKVPEELRGLAEKYVQRLEEQHAEVRRQIEETVLPVLARLGGDRRALGRYSQEHAAELGMARSALFLLLDGKTDRFEEMIKELIYPSGNHFIGAAKQSRTSDDTTGPALC